MMTEKKKYEKWRQVAFLMAEEKRAFLDEPSEKEEKIEIDFKQSFPTLGEE